MSVTSGRSPAARRLVDGALALACAAAALLLYLRTLAPGLLWGDSAEFQFAAWLAGFAHPTGYPLYLMLGWLWSHVVPIHDPAWRMNAFSALWGGVAVGLTYFLAVRTLRPISPARLGDRAAAALIRIAAVMVALSLAVVPVFWSQAVIAEVYSLNAAFLAGLLLAIVIWAERRDRGWLYAAAGLYGLSLAHHRTVLLLAPAIAAYLWLVRGGRTAQQGGASIYVRGGRAPARPSRLRPILTAVALLVLPQLLYLYLPLLAAHAPYASAALGPKQELVLYEPTVGGFLAHVSGEAFGSDLGLGRTTPAGLRDMAHLFIRELSWPGLVLGLLGVIAWGLRKGPRRLLVLTGLGFLAITGFNLVYGIGDIHVFYIPAYLIWTLWIGAGVLALAELSARLRAIRAVAPAVLVVLALALPLWRLAVNYSQADRSGDRSARQVWEEILAQPIPENAALITNDRDEMAPQWYLKYVEGVRPDLVGLFPLLQAGSDWSNVALVGDQGLRSGRPVVAIKPMPGLEVKFQLETMAGASGTRAGLGSLIRIAGPAVSQAPQRSSEALFGEAVRLTGFDLQPEMIGSSGELIVTLYWQPQRRLNADYTSFVHLVNADGATVGQSDHRPGGVYYPTTLWSAGELLRDEHRLRLTPDLGRPPYELQVGLYTGTTELRHLGTPQRIGYVGGRQASALVPADLENRVDAVLGEQIALLGYEAGASGGAVVLDLYWQALQPPAGDYSAFLHLIDGEGRIVAQHDGPPAGALPTSAWPQGLAVLESKLLLLPDDLPSGVYRLIAGLYDPVTADRLLAAGPDGRVLGDAVPLGQLTLPTP